MSITVIVPARNEEKFIGRTIDSLLNQSINPSQIIVVLDRCTDHTEEIVDEASMSNDKVRKVIKNSTKYDTFMKGFLVAETINAGLENAKPFPDYIMVANADSIYSETYLQEALEILNNDPSCGMVGYPHYSTISGSGYVVRSSLLYKLGNKIKECAAEDTYLQLAVLNFGYKIRFIQNAKVTLLRERGNGSLKERLKYAFAKGYGAYTLGYSLYYQATRTLYWIVKGKFSYIGIIFGFIYGLAKQAEKLDLASTHAAKDWQKARIYSTLHADSRKADLTQGHSLHLKKLMALGLLYLISALILIARFIYFRVFRRQGYLETQQEFNNL